MVCNFLSRPISLNETGSEMKRSPRRALDACIRKDGVTAHMNTIASPRKDMEIGRAIPRRTTQRLVAGGGCYVDDVSINGELQAAFLRSPHGQASFVINDTASAMAIDGVVRVLTATDLDAVCQPWTCQSAAFPGMVSPEQRPLAKDHALYQGEPVAMVLARSRAIAEDAVERITVDWTERPAVAVLANALDDDAPSSHPDLKSNLAWQTRLRAGEPEQTFANAALVVSERLSFARKTGVPLEARGVLAHFDVASGTLIAHMSHQMPHQMQLHLSELLGLPLVDVRVVCGDVGGGFGIKMHVYPDEIAVCAASRLTGRPIKFIADRIESLASDIHAREHIVEARMALDADGKILGFDIDDLQGLGAYSVFPRSSVTEAMSALRAIGGPYRFDHFRASLRSALQNKVMTGQYRSVGHPIACMVTERLVDIAAKARGEDPLTLRRRNFVRDDEMPWVSPQGARMIDLSHGRCLDKLVGLMDLDGLRASIAAMRANNRLVGLGFASFLEFTATGAAGYGLAGVPVAAVDTVIVTLEPSGEVRAQCSASEIGQGIQQGLAQIIADAVGLPADSVRVFLGDTQAAPHGGGAWSSRGAAITGEAAWGAGRKLREQTIAAAAALLQAEPETLDILAGQVVDAATATVRISLREIAKTATFRGFDFPVGTRPQLTAAFQYGREADPFLPTNGIQASLVEVEADTGLVTVMKHWVVEDCGRVINPLLVDEQIRGGVVQGVGEALFEACRYNADAQLTSGSLADYLLPMASEMPDIIIRHVETPYSGSLLGAKGAGEAGTCGAAAAVLNAVNDALALRGASINTLPITPPAVLQALGVIADEPQP
jgi:carbon-monoxide dehydrogenase large subunit